MNAIRFARKGVFLMVICAAAVAQEETPQPPPADSDPPVAEGQLQVVEQPAEADEAGPADDPEVTDGEPELAEGEPVTEQATDTSDAVSDPAPAEPPVADDAAEAPQTDATAATVDLSEIMDMLRSQQDELKAQRELIEQQGRDVASLRDELDALRAPPVVDKPDDAQEAVQAMDHREDPIAMDAAPDEGATPAPVTDVESDEARSEASQQVTEAQTDDPTRDTLEDFVGSWRLPGTEAALRIGGYVKANVVNSFDPMAITDRFIVGSIPVGAAEPGVEAESSVTANQSRLNFDLREPTKLGLLRAFVEGDFAEDEDTFRLRHAFGQWNRVLAGKTWSAFVDTQASPEEIDFEGLNGRINVRQSQVRVMPRIGRQFEFQVSLEDPNPSIENGEGVSRRPDVVASGRFDWRDDLHVKVGAIVRQIRGQWDGNPGNTEEDNGWGLTVSGRLDFPVFDERDSVLFQLNAGKGIGRYVTDLSSVGQFDGRFDPITGELELIDVVSGYFSAQHWWAETLRTNLTMGYVQVDYSGFETPDDYDSTLRVSTNVIWSPTPRIDLGGELLWGRRENQDGENGDAVQAQLAAKYRF